MRTLAELGGGDGFPGKLRGGRGLTVAGTGLAARNAGGTNSLLRDPAEWLVEALGGRRAASGLQVTAGSALRVAAVFACVSILSRTVATLPVKVYRRTGDDGTEEAPDHPLWDVLRTEPNPEMSGVDFFGAGQANLSLHNNAFAEVVSDRSGTVRELWPVHPSEVTPRRSRAGRIVYEISEQRDPASGEVVRPARTVLADEMLHVRGLSFDGLAGVSNLSCWREVIGLAQALDTNASKFFGNGSRLGLILSHPGKLSDEAREFLKSQIEDRYTGVENAFRTMVLQEGMGVANPRADNESSQMDESRQRQAREVCALFGVPPHKAGVSENIPRANVEEANRDFVINTIRPIVTLWEAALNRTLIPRDDRGKFFVEFQLGGLERGNMADRYASYASGRQWGFLSVNEIRKLENLNPVDGGDEYLRPVNMVPVGEESEEGEQEGMESDGANGDLQKVAKGTKGD